MGVGGAGGLKAHKVQLGDTRVQQGLGGLPQPDPAADWSEKPPLLLLQTGREGGETAPAQRC